MSKRVVLAIVPCVVVSILSGPASGQTTEPPISTPDHRPSRAFEHALASVPHVSRAVPLDQRPVKDDGLIRAHLARRQSASVRELYSDMTSEQRGALFGDGNVVISEEDLDFWLMPTEDPNDSAVAAFPSGTEIAPDGSIVAEPDFIDTGISWTGSWDAPRPATATYFFNDDGGVACGETQAEMYAYWDGRRQIENFASDYVGVHARATMKITRDNWNCYDWIEFGYVKMWSSDGSARWSDWAPEKYIDIDCRSTSFSLTGIGVGISTNIAQACDVWAIPLGISVHRAADFGNPFYVRYQDGEREDDQHFIEGFGLLKLPAGGDSGRRYRFYMDPENVGGCGLCPFD